ncbi:sugar ABC transporter substrate-binding protein [Bacillus fonticola]|uniref:sugar ABC transporter substrate-binding protein n=1 Tax=Bacillus fonticola TaxID=2728853 RepID=UPI00147588B7|nr:extracellular solute-binding protein [Bacillus fonticola]
MKKFFSLFFMMMLVVVVLAACGPSREEVQEEGGTEEENENEGLAEGEEPEKPESLTVWVNDQDVQLEALGQIFDKYEEETGITIEETPMSMLDQVDAISLDGPNGNGPDLFYQPHDRIGDIVQRGLAAPVDLSDVEDQYTSAALEAMQVDGEYMGIPMVVETYATFYNKDLVSEAPETMEEVMTIAAEQTSGENYGFLMEAANFYYTYPFLASNGGYVFGGEAGSYDIEDIGLNNEGSVAGAEMIQSWYENGYIPTDLTADILNGLFQEGQVGVVINGPWMVRDYSAALGDSLGTTILPALDNGETPKSLVGVKAWLVSDYAEENRQYWAADLAKFVSNEENSLLYFDIAGELPANSVALESEAVTSDELISAFAEQIQYGEPMPNNPEVQQIWEPINNALSFIAQGEPVEDVLNEAVEIIKTNIEIANQ